MVKKRPRLADVARLVGVSEATVSVVMNNRVGESARISPATQQRVWDAVRELGYVANPMARSLAGGRNHIMSVFTFEQIFPLTYGNFYYPFLIGIEEEASRQGYDLLLSTRVNNKGQHCIYENGVNRLQVADGAILLGYGDRKGVNKLSEEGFPFVFVGRRESSNDDISYAAGDYTAAVIEVVKNVVAFGHQKIAYIRTNRTDESALDRAAGFTKAQDQFQYDPTTWQGEYHEFTVDVVQSLLNEGNTAFLLEDDSFGEQLVNHSQLLNKQLPSDFSMVVLGDPLNEQTLDYTWADFKVPRLEMGREAVRLLIKILESPKNTLDLPVRVVVPCRFNKGDTLGTVPKD